MTRSDNPTKPSVYTARVDGRDVAAVSAASRREATELKREAWFLEELACKKDKDGRPLWDGAAHISFQLAEPIHLVRYNEALKEAVARAKPQSGDLFIAWFP